MTQAGVGTNRYAYAANDPVNLRDPGGNEVIGSSFNADGSENNFSPDQIEIIEKDAGKVRQKETDQIRALRMAAEFVKVGGLPPKGSAAYKALARLDKFLGIAVGNVGMTQIDTAISRSQKMLSTIGEKGSGTRIVPQTDLNKSKRAASVLVAGGRWGININNMNDLQPVVYANRAFFGRLDHTRVLAHEISHISNRVGDRQNGSAKLYGSAGARLAVKMGLQWENNDNYVFSVWGPPQ